MDSIALSFTLSPALDILTGGEEFLWIFRSVGGFEVATCTDGYGPAFQIPKNGGAEENAAKSGKNPLATEVFTIPGPRIGEFDGKENTEFIGPAMDAKRIFAAAADVNPPVGLDWEIGSSRDGRPKGAGRPDRNGDGPRRQPGGGKGMEWKALGTGCRLNLKYI